MEDWDGIGRLLGYTNEKAMLMGLYIEEGLSVKEISSRLNCGIATIAGRLAKHSIPKRPRGGANNMHKVSLLLFRMDQRIVFLTPGQELAQALQVHESTIYKYKRSVQSIHPRKDVTWNSAQSVPLQD